MYGIGRDTLIFFELSTRNRNEKEIAGYREVLGMIHDSYFYIQQMKPVPSKCCFGMGQWCSQSMGLGETKQGNKPRAEKEAGLGEAKLGNKPCSSIV